MIKNKIKGYTFIELIAVLVIMLMIFLIVTPLVMNIIRKSRISARKRSVDAYGRSVELTIAGYLLNTGKLPKEEDLPNLKVEYSGSTVVCNVMKIKENGGLYLSECSVNSINVLDSSTDDGWYHYGDSFNLSAVKTLLAKANDESINNYIDGNTHEMYTFSHEQTAQTESLIDYRYIGNDPYNYVFFNDDELWRIIGIFTVEDENGNLEQRIKIIKNKMLNGNKPVHSSRLNDWPRVNMNSYLNGDYYNSLSDDAKSMIADAKYYLGGLVFNSSAHWGDGSQIYKWERGVEVYTGRSTNWTGKIALAYPSDYVYTYALGVDNTCYNDSLFLVCQNSSLKGNSWLHNTNNNNHQWLLSPYSVNGRDIFLWYLVGGGANNSVTLSYGIQPSLYLSAKVKIDSGDGTLSNPYRLKM